MGAWKPQKEEGADHFEKLNHLGPIRISPLGSVRNIKGEDEDVLHCLCGAKGRKMKSFSITDTSPKAMRQPTSPRRRRLPAITALAPVPQPSSKCEWFTPSVIISIMFHILMLVNVLFIAAAVCVFLRSNANKKTRKRRRSEIRARDSMWSEVMDRML